MSLMRSTTFKMTVSLMLALGWKAWLVGIAWSDNSGPLAQTADNKVKKPKSERKKKKSA